MKKVKKKLCKLRGCKVWFTQTFSSTQQVCSPACAYKYEIQKKEDRVKADKKRNKLKLIALKPRSYWVKKAITAFNKYIRERDKDLPCISCGRHHTGQYHAGHMLSRGARPELQFHPANNNKQCSPCNVHLSGNISLYRPALIKKVGLEMVEYLENFNKPQRLTIEDIKEIEQHYKDELKEIITK